MNPHLTYVLTAGVCLVALACGHEATTPPRLRETRRIEIEPVVAAPITTVETEPAQPAPLPAPAASRSGEACVELDTELGGKHITLEGRVVVDDAHQHPTRGKTHPYILRLDAPRCAIGTEEPSVTELHLASGDGVSLKPLVGQRVRASGDPFAAHTAWHARPVVLMTTTATRLQAD